jgi:hypothetical protein
MPARRSMPPERVPNFARARSSSPTRSIARTTAGRTLAAGRTPGRRFPRHAIRAGDPGRPRHGAIGLSRDATWEADRDDGRAAARARRPEPVVVALANRVRQVIGRPEEVDHAGFAVVQGEHAGHAPRHSPVAAHRAGVMDAPPCAMLASRISPSCASAGRADARRGPRRCGR